MTERIQCHWLVVQRPLCGALRRTSGSHEHPSTRPRVTTAATPGARKIADALRSTVMSKLAQLHARVGSRRHCCKDCWRPREESARQYHWLAEGNATRPAFEFVVEMHGPCGKSPPFCIGAPDQTPLKCDGTNDAHATWQRRRGSNRSQQQRNGICIFRWCQDGLCSDDSHEKKHLLRHWLCAVVAFAVGDLCLRGRTRPHQTTPVVARNILDCITEQKRESWIGTEDHGPCDAQW